MRIIHCSDLHLDSKMRSNLDKDKARERRSEILRNFDRLVSFALQNSVKAILIAGDLFDTNIISATAKNAVYSAIKDNPEIDFYYLKGNHDRDNFISDMPELPGNLHTFTDEMTSYPLGETGLIKLYGAELSENSASVQTGFTPDPSMINIVMLHGQESGSLSKDKAEIIDIKQFRNKGINYLALGHVHEYKCEPLDSEGVYCYSGCLEGRGFDECGEKGFVLLSVDEEKKSVTHEFVPFSQRKLYCIEADITDMLTSREIVGVVREKLINSGAGSGDMVKVVLTGRVDVTCEKDTEYIVKLFEDDYYFIKVYDETQRKVDYDRYMLDESLKGEFVRLVKESDLSEEKKATIIMYGLNAISGGKFVE